MLQVLIADDSAIVRAILMQILEQSKGKFKVIGVAKNGEEAIRMAQNVNPDLIIMDFSMPLINGIEATREIIETCENIAILIFSGSVNAENTFQAIGFGAAKVMEKPTLDQLNNREFIQKFYHILESLPRSGSKKEKDTSSLFENTQIISGSSIQEKVYEIVVLGASTGGPIAISQLLNKIPKNFTLPIIIVQHLEEGFDKDYAKWLDSETELNVRLANNGEIPEKGTVYISPATCHLIFEGKKIVHNHGVRVLNQKPSIDRLFETAAGVYGRSLISILLTGMGADGAQGSLVVKNKGGFTIVQNKETCAIFGMPKAAIEKGAATIILPLMEIPTQLFLLTKNKNVQGV